MDERCCDYKGDYYGHQEVDGNEPLVLAHPAVLHPVAFDAAWHDVLPEECLDVAARRLPVVPLAQVDGKDLVGVVDALDALVFPDLAGQQRHVVDLAFVQPVLPALGRFDQLNRRVVGVAGLVEPEEGNPTASHGHFPFYSSPVWGAMPRFYLTLLPTPGTCPLVKVPRNTTLLYEVGISYHLFALLSRVVSDNNLSNERASPQAG